MKIHSLERIYLGLCAVLLALGVVAVALSVFARGIHLVGPAGTVNAQEAAESPPFDELGLVEVAPGQYQMTMLAQMWQWNPVLPTTPLEIPVGSTVHFKLTSTDVTHGLMIRDTTVNAMVIPGQVTDVTYTFDRPGEYLIICHEYCGIAHHQMYGKVVVS